MPGLRDPRQTETSGSVLLPPAQDQRYMIAGGGGIGESKLTTDRTDIIDLNEAKPHFSPGPDLEKPVRYPSMVITPDDKVVITGGSTGYRGKGNSDVLLCHLYDPKSNTLTKMADPTVGRDYHSEALLLPDGRVITLGSNPLFSDAKDTIPGTFEQRIEIYSPPYLYQGDRPEISGGTAAVKRGDTVWFAHAQRARDQDGAAGAPERGHARDRRGAALDQAGLHPERRRARRDDAQGRRAGARGLVHAVRDGRERGAVEGALGGGAMRVAFLTVFGFAALAMAPPAHAAPALFESPSHNIGCYLSKSGVRCDIRQHAWKAPPKPKSCDVDWGSGLEVGAAASGAGCARATRSSAARRCWPTASRSSAAASSARAAATECAA